MALDRFKNFAVVTLGGTIDAAVTTNLNLGTGNAAKLPAVPFNAVIWNSTDYATPDLDPNTEILRFTSVTSDTVNVFARAQEGTAAATHNTGGKTYKLLATVTAKALQDISRTLVSGVGVLDSTVTVATTFLPSAITIPAGAIAVGDRLIIQAFWRRRNPGAMQNTVQGTISTTLGGASLPGSFGFLAAENTFDVITKINFRSSLKQSWLFIGTRPSSQIYSGDAITTLDETTALTVDIQGNWNSAATDTLSLEHYEITLQKAVAF